MSLMLKLFLLIIGAKLIASYSNECITDCTYQSKSTLIPKNGFYCVINQRKEGYLFNTTEWRVPVSCNQDRPFVDGSQMPYLFRYRAKNEGYNCNGRCAHWHEMSFDWCFDEYYNRFGTCDPDDPVYDAQKVWPNFQTHLEDKLQTYQGHEKQLSSSPMNLGIEETYNKIAVGPKEFYKYDTMTLNNPVKKYITVYPPGSASFGPRELTAGMSARIYTRHIRQQDMCAESDVTLNRYKSLSPKNHDDIQVLLKITLGGGLDFKNIVPLAVYTKIDGNNTMVFNQDIIFLDSIENVVQKFLENDSLGYVDWTALILYGNLMRSYRPKAIFYKFVFKNFDNTLYDFGHGLLKGKSQIEFIVKNDNPEYLPYDSSFPQSNN